MKKLFENKIERLTAKRNDLKQRALNSKDIDEVRSIQEKIDDIDADNHGGGEEERLQIYLLDGG